MPHPDITLCDSLLTNIPRKDKLIINHANVTHTESMRTEIPHMGILHTDIPQTEILHTDTLH